MNRLFRLFRSLDADQSGFGLSLQDIEDDDEVAADITNEKPLASIEDVNAGDSLDDPDTDKPKPPTPEAPKNEKPKDGADKDKEEEETTDDADKDATEGDVPVEDEDAEKFFAEVAALRGDELDVEYGDVDPMSPEGIVLRDAAVEANAVIQFEATLKAKYPDSYAYFLHTQAGGSREEFFGSGKRVDILPTEEEISASQQIQETMVLEDLKAKGTSDKHAALIIKAAKEDDELEELAKEALKSKKAANDKYFQEIEAETAKAIAKQKEAILDMSKYVDNVVKEGKIGKLTIPASDQAAFANEFKKNIQISGNDFVYVVKVTNDNIQELFEKEFFGFKKGNLKDLVAVEAKTQNVLRLKRTLPKNTVPKTSPSKAKDNSDTLGGVDAD